MKFTLLISLLLSAGLVNSSCSMIFPPRDYVREEVPVRFLPNEKVSFQIHSLSGNGVNIVGLRCSPIVWRSLTNGFSRFEVRLIPPTSKGVQVGAVKLGGIGPTGRPYGMLYVIPDTDRKSVV